MLPFSGRRKLFRYGIVDMIRSYVANAAWPLAGKGEADDATRHQAFFRSYGTQVSDMQSTPENLFRGHGQTYLETRVRSLGQFSLPSIPTSASARTVLSNKGITGIIIAPSNPNRTRLFLRFDGPPNALVILSGEEFVTIWDYQIDFTDPSSREFVSQNIVYAACTRTGCTLYVAEEELLPQ
jgi:hypothetical protein